MTNEQITEGNKLFKEFLKLKISGKQPMGDTAIHYDMLEILGYNYLSPEHFFQFHSSWDWLLPVVKRIAANRNIMDPSSIKIAEIFTNVYRWFMDADIDPVYLACVEFINWYNEQE